jgi:hypothetical protein
MSFKGEGGCAARFWEIVPKEMTMKKLFVAIDGALGVVSWRGGEWVAELHLVGSHPMCVAVDPLHQGRVYCGTFGQGLWRSWDGGDSWVRAGEGITHKQVMAVAVSGLEVVGDAGVIYAGSEPTALFRSEDGGETWRELAALRALPSAPTWSFPPRPYTSHIRWITPDPLVAGRVFAAVEAGALLRSLDGGETWEDRKPGGPFDTHTLVMHRLAPERLYSAAGDGFMRPGDGFVISEDGGETWYRSGVGLEHHYLWSVAVDPADPTTVVISAARGPQEAHNPRMAESAIYRRSGSGALQQRSFASAQDDRGGQEDRSEQEGRSAQEDRGEQKDIQGSWQMVREGLPEPRGLLTSVLAANEAEAGVFYAANNKGVFRSADGGCSWEAMPIRWPAGTHLGRAHALVVGQD